MKKYYTKDEIILALVLPGMAERIFLHRDRRVNKIRPCSRAGSESACIPPPRNSADSMRAD